MIWALPANRRQLVDVLSARGRFSGHVSERCTRLPLHALDTHEMVLAWPSDPAEINGLPTLIVVDEGKIADSLAWFATYMRDLRPFTAHCRVVDKWVAQRFEGVAEVPRLREMEGPVAGLVLGEALTRSSSGRATTESVAIDYFGTLSFTIGRTLALSEGAVPLEKATELWGRAKALTGRADPDSVATDTEFVWSVMLGFFGGTPSRSLFDEFSLLVSALSEIASVGDFSARIWKDLAAGINGIDDVRKIGDFPRERRIEILDQALRGLTSSPEYSGRRRDFLLGFIVSQLAPGTLDHWPILAPLVTHFPSAGLWFGLFAGINVKGEALPVGHPTARRVIRDLTVRDNLLDRPRCDVAIEELAIQGSREFVLAPNRNRRLDVDIFPGVTVACRWDPVGAASEERVKRVRNMELRRLLSDMDELMYQWSRTGRKLLEAVEEPADRENSTEGKKRRRP